MVSDDSIVFKAGLKDFGILTLSLLTLALIVMRMTSLPLFSLLLNTLGPLRSLAGEGRGEKSHDSEIIIINICD